MTNYKTRSNEEARTLELMAQVRASAQNSADVIVANVFSAMWASSLTVDQVKNIGEAMHGFLGLDVQEVLTRLTRKKVLRSRRQNSTRFYEVNY